MFDKRLSAKEQCFAKNGVEKFSFYLEIGNKIVFMKLFRNVFSRGIKLTRADGTLEIVFRPFH